MALNNKAEFILTAVCPGWGCGENVEVVRNRPGNPPSKGTAEKLICPFCGEDFMGPDYLLRRGGAPDTPPAAV